MVKQGLIEEVKALKDQGYTKDLISMQGLGYKEILDYLDGVTSLDEALYILKRDTRHFAKRQITWFKREKKSPGWIRVNSHQKIPLWISCLNSCGQRELFHKIKWSR